MKIQMKIEGAIQSRVSIQNPSFLLQTHKMRQHLIFQNTILFNVAIIIDENDIERVFTNKFYQTMFLSELFPGCMIHHVSVLNWRGNMSVYKYMLVLILVSVLVQVHSHSKSLIGFCQ